MPLFQPPLIQLQRTELVKTINSVISPNQSLQTSLEITPSFNLFTIVCLEPIRLRLYSRANYQVADVDRDLQTDPTGDHGVLFEGAFDSENILINLAPIVEIVNLEDNPDNWIPATITNLGNNNISNFDIEFIYFPIEN